MKMRAPDHKGMKVDYLGMLGQSATALRAAGYPAQAFMLEELREHLTAMGSRFYAGDVSVVDEFLQLYCIARLMRDTPVPADTEAVINQLARELPEGYEVDLCIERGAAWG